MSFQCHFCWPKLNLFCFFTHGRGKPAVWVQVLRKQTGRADEHKLGEKNSNMRDSLKELCFYEEHYFCTKENSGEMAIQRKFRFREKLHVDFFLFLLDFLEGNIPSGKY